ncbi:hypothetical protein L202_05571 [Cryptococcus amylolentus CBS 6039]|uniref:Glycoside hydrolase family 88 protein n=1 Tax=Cryptococcus amylolentus CBS 6039 TaxID=1295533 RepID=A0A1E3HMS6_9TREE|nr:hypothetical protein L202_05571 [Cryptococcus amylolentus CBS 6039]ODN77026.1 hypothetical protein L202_05571 [Cryptococcus amylolentus CBS 6039]
MDKLQRLPHSIPALYDISDSIKLVEVAKKYEGPEDELVTRVPEYTYPGGPNGYHCSKVSTSWTQGFFPGLLWLLVERQRLLPESVSSTYSENEITRLARRYQEGFRDMARTAMNHDQGFRFQLSFGKDLELNGSEEGKKALLEAADSLVDLYSPEVACIRSWKQMIRSGVPNDWRADNQHEHYLVIIDNLMNLDMLYEATELTGKPIYAEIATSQCEKSMHSHVRPDFTTYHVVDFNQDGTVKKAMTCQGFEDESTWSRGQAWGIHGYAQSALRTGRADFLETACRLADKFIELLPESGVPWWDFDAPKPCPYDASASTIAAVGLLWIFIALRKTDPGRAEQYLTRAFKLVEDVLEVCKTAKAEIDEEGKVRWGEGGWETILKVSCDAVPVLV